MHSAELSEEKRITALDVRFVVRVEIGLHRLGKRTSPHLRISKITDISVTKVNTKSKISDDHQIEIPKQKYLMIGRCFHIRIPC